MKHVGSCLGVGQGTMVGGHRASKVCRQSLQLEVSNVGPNQSSRQGGGVDSLILELSVAESDGRRIEERHVESDVVADDDRIADEFEERGEDRLDSGGIEDHGLGDAGEDGDRRGNRGARVNEGLKRRDEIAALVFDGTDLRDLAIGGRTAGGLQVEHAESDIDEAGGEVVEAGLEGNGHAHDKLSRTYVRCQEQPYECTARRIWLDQHPAGHLDRWRTAS